MSQPIRHRLAVIAPSSDEQGQTLVEYGLLIGLLAIVIIFSLLYLGPIISQLFQNIGTTLA